jgi:hypothetical protein
MLQGGVDQDVLSRLLGFGQPQDIGGIMGQIPGIPYLQNIAGGQSPYQMALSRLLGAGVLPERAGLNAIVSGSPTSGAQNRLSALFDTIAMEELPGLPDVFAALDAQRRPALDRDIRDLRELFGSQGLRFSSDLAGAVGQRQSESEANILAEVARILPQLSGARTQSVQTLGNIGQTIGQLALGEQGNILQGLGTAGQLGLEGTGLDMNALAQLISGQAGAGSILGQLGTSLFQGGQGNALQALLGLPGAQGAFREQQLGGIERLLGLGTGFQQLQQQPLDRQYAEFQRQLAMLPAILGFFGGTPAPNVGPSPLSQIGNLAIGAAGTAIGAKGIK